MRKTRERGPDEYSVAELLHGKTHEIFGIVQHLRKAVTIVRYGKPVARIVPIDPPLGATSLPVNKLSTLPVPK